MVCQRLHKSYSDVRGDKVFLESLVQFAQSVAFEGPRSSKIVPYAKPVPGKKMHSAIHILLLFFQDEGGDFDEDIIGLRWRILRHIFNACGTNGMHDLFMFFASRAPETPFVADGRVTKDKAIHFLLSVSPDLVPIVRVAYIRGIRDFKLDAATFSDLAKNFADANFPLADVQI